MTEFQIPNPKLQINSKLQTPTGVQFTHDAFLDFGGWNLFGIWILGFGIFA
jgi:hypothetical protein